METHRKKLSNICRLCCRKINFTKHYKTAKTCNDQREKILFLFNHDVTKDNGDQHPPNICEKCAVKINLVDVANSSHNQVNKPIANFDAHDLECTLCRLHKLPEYIFKFEKRPSFGLKIIQAAALNYSFSPIDSECDGQSLSLIQRKFVGDNLQSCKTLVINSSFSWKFYFWDKLISPDVSPIIANMPKFLSLQNTNSFFEEINACKLCIGNDDFQDLIACKVEGIHWSNAHLFDNKLNQVEPDKWTIRSEKCELVLSRFHQPDRCAICFKYRKYLQKVKSRIENIKSSTVKKKRPHVSCTKKQLRKKLFTSSVEIKELQKQKLTLQRKIENSVQRDGIQLDEAVHNNVSSVSSGEESKFEKDSVMHLLWQQQQKANSMTNKRSMRWHPVIIRWCLSIYSKSPGTYSHLRNTGFLQLPHRTTLNQYTNFTDIGTGYNMDVIKRLHDDFKLDNVDNEHRICSLLIDEMKIKSGLLFSRHTGKLVGFTELGETNQELTRLEHALKDEDPSSNDLATHILTVMARGIIKRFNYPIGYFATKTADADQLFNIIWDGIGCMEMSGIKVMSIISDGASQNRKFYAMHRLADNSNVSPEGCVFWCWNRYDNSRKIYFFSDPPHLMKTIRNNLEKSASGGTRNLMVNGNQICWSHIRNVYESDLNLNTMVPGLRKLHKITFDHIHLTPRLRMRVNLAVQVLSTSMADALKSQDLEHTKETEKLIRMVDQFFDIMNISQTFEGKKARKPALHPFKNVDDWRFEWLEKTFLKYINDWKNTTTVDKKISKEEQAKRCLSYQTLEGIRITVRSFLGLIPELLRINGVECILTDRFNQDPLEEHFGKQRSRGGGVDNPTILQYMYNERKIIVSKSDMIIKGNTRGRKRDKDVIDITDQTLLPKRKKQKKD